MKIISWMTDALILRGYIDADDRSIFLYGFDIIFYTIWSTTLLLLIGLILHQFVPVVIILFFFYTFQSVGGGYHANTHLSCLATMIIGLLAGLSLSFLKDRTIILWLLLGLGAVILFLFPLVLHPNKAYLMSQRNHLIMRSFIMTTASLILVIIFNLFWSNALFAFSAAFFLAGISRISGKLKYQ